MPADNLGDTTVGVAYTHTITATGGSGTLTYSASGLPAGLTMSGSGTISGTATAPGDFSVTVTASDSAGQTASQAYPLKVFPAPALAPAALPDGTVGTAYSATASATGGKAPVTLSQSGGTLPSGLTFNAATGVLAGTPDTAGAAAFTLQARDANGATGTQSYTVTVSAALSLTANVPGTANVGGTYSGLLAASGGKAPITYSVASGLLPPGISLGATTGSITGTPTFAGTYSVTLAATDANGAIATKAATINVFSNAPPAVVTTTLPNGVVGAAYSASLIAQFGRPPYAWSLASGSTLPAGLTLAANGTISGTPAATGPTDFQVVVTDANGQTATGALRISVFTALAIGTSALPEGYATLAYPSTSLSASGGQGPYSWSLAGALPTGLVFTASTATLSGTPAAGTAGSYGVTFTVTDTSGQTQSASFTITLYALPAVTTTTLADGSVGASYSQLLQASGGKSPLSWSITTGSLPAGVLLDPSSGGILGTPTAAGTSTFIVQVSDTNGKTATRLLSINVFNGLAITYGPAPDAYTNTAYNQTLTASGGRAPYTWSLAAGALPAGVTLNGSTGTLGGTPTAPGTSNFTLQVTDANTVTATKALSITVYDPPRITTASLPDGYVGQLYPSVTLQGTGGKTQYAWSISAGTLPPGLTLTSQGVLSGTPTAVSSASITVTLTDANGRAATQSYTFGTFTLPAISTTSLADGYTGSAYSRTVTTSNTGKLPITWTVVAGSLPAGLSLADSATQQDTGVISGTPTTAGTATFTVRATDANNQAATQSLSIAVFAPPSIANGSLPDGTLSQAYSATLVPSGGKSPYAWTLPIGSLPAGLSLNGATGAITGTPTAPGSSSFTVQLADANGVTSSKPFTITVYTSLTISTSSPLPAGEQGAAFSQTVRAVGGRTPISFTLTAGSLPPGLSMAASPPDGEAIGGTPTTPGTYSFTLTATDSTTPTPQTTSKAFQVTIAPPVTITTPALADGYLGLTYSDAVVAANGVPPYRFALASGSTLPAGLNLDPNTGAVSGSPTATGPTTFTATATDALNQVATRTYTVTVYTSPSITTASPLRDAYAGTAFSLTFAGTGGKTPYGWSQPSGTLPAGLTLDSAGNLNGTPATAGTYAFSIKLTDANNQAAIKSFTQEVLAPPAITTTSVPEGYVGVGYPVTTIAGTGGRTPYTFTLQGSLPAGLTFTNGTISGTPTTAQSGVSFQVTLTDANGTAAVKTFTTSIYTLPAITPAAIPDAYSGTAYAYTLSGSGGKTPYTWTLASGALPAGLTLSTAGAISGTTTAVGTASFVLQLADANGKTATLSTSMAVLPALQLTTVALPDGYLTTAYNGVLAAAGGKTPYTFSIAGALPAGLSLNAGSGAITGTPTAAGTSNFTAQVTDANGKTATAALSIAVFALPQIGTTALADAYAGSAYSASVAGTGGKTPYTFAVTTGTLPAGLSLAAGGAITGTPTGAPGTSTFTVTLTDANGVTATKSLTITVLSALAVTTANLADGYTASAYNQTLAATGGKTPYRWSSGALPAGLSLSISTGAITGTPTATGTTTVSFTVSDANNVSASRSLTITVYAPPQVTAATLPDAYPSIGYLATIAGTGGKTPYSFSAGAGLPAGLTMSSAGAISGNTTASPGTATFTVTLTDANGVTATQSFSIVVRADLALTTTSLPDAYVSSGYSATLAASGGKTPYTWALGSGTLPVGVTLDTVAGALSGTPTTAGTSSFTIRVTDANGVTASRALTIQTYALPAITTATLSNAVVNTAYNQPLAMTGGKAPFTWSESGTLPAGITFSTATGTFSGTPTATGTFPNIAVVVTDANGRASPQIVYTLNVVNTVTITTVSITDAYQGVAFSQTLTAAGGLGAPYTFTVTAGALPAGLTLSSTGVLSGTPTAAVGSYSFTIQARDSGTNTGTKAFTQSVWLPPSVTTTTLPDGYTDQSYSSTLAGTGGRTPYTWSVSAGALPAGITLTGGTGTFSGQPTAAGTSTFTIQLSDANGVTATKSLTIASFAPPSQTSPSTLADAYTSTAYNVTLAVTGGKAPVTWSAGTGLPPGITLSSAGVLSGTATATGAFTFSTTATDANGRTAVTSHTINVFAPLAITTASPLPDGYRAVAYNVTLASTGGSPPVTWSLTSGALPAGLSLGSGGAITGTPTASGTFNFSVTVTDKNGIALSKAFALTVQPPLAVTKTTVADGYVGRPYSDAMTATGGRPPYGWTLSSGTLPAGLTLSAAGALSGTPAATGSSSFVVTVTDANGTTATQALTLVVFAPPSITTTSFADAYAGQAYSATAAGTGGKTPYTWSVSAGALPAGLTLNAATGAITGTTTGTTQTFTLTLTDANGVTASQVFTLSVFNMPAITSTSPLADGYAGQPYSFTFAASGGKAPLTWQQTAGAPPTGLTISSAGALGTTIGAAGQNVAWTFTVTVTDANGKVASAPFTMTTYVAPSITNASLTTATEGVTYLKAPATPEQLVSANGKSPLTFSAGSGLPSGITLAGATGIFSGIPAQGTAGAHSVTFTVTDANGKTGTATLNLQVKVAAPVYGGGTVGVAPAGSPITDTLTVFTTDYEGRRYPNLGVRIRKNGVEYAPVKEALTDVAGKVVFTGLGLNGTTDTVDVTVNGKDVANESWQKINAAIVSVPMMDYPVPMPRSYANGEVDPVTGKLIVTGGFNPTQVGGPGINSLFSSTQNDLVRLTDSVLGTWSEDLPPGMNSAPPLRWWAGMAYANNVHVLFGGADPNTWAPLNDTWHYSVATGAWTRSLAGGVIPSPRNQFAMATVGSLVYVFGGAPGAFSGAPLNDMSVYSYNPATAQWQSTPPFGGPSPRYNMAATGALNQLWICGGFDGFTEQQDCWSFDPTSFFWQSRGPMPGPRQGASMAATTSGNIYVFGGTTSGVTRNDLLVSFGGGPFTPVAAINPPPPREGAVLAAEPSTGRLILFGGQTNGLAFNDVWTFDPATNTWTQRTLTFTKAPVGFTLSGAITNGSTSNRSRVTVEVSGLSGYTNRQVFNLTSGSGSYTVTGIPAGDSVSLTVLNEDLNQATYPNREWSWIDLGVIATNVSGNLTQNVTLPSGPMTPQLLTATGSYTLPSGWLGTDFAASLARLTRPGYANHPNGFYQATTATKTFRSDYFPPAAGTTETLVPEVESSTAANCELSITWVYNVSPGPLAPVVFPPGPRSLSPGISGCASTGTGLASAGILQSPGSTGAPGVSVGDLNGDGIADIALLTSNQVLIFNGLNSGEGSFGGVSNTLTLPVGNANSLAIADFDKNGRPDVVVGVSGTNQLAVFLQTAPGVFSPAAMVGAGTQVQGLVTGDFNGDGNPDVVVMGSSPIQINELTGRGDGTFNAFVTVFNGPTNFTAIAAAEFNGDTFTDVAYTVGAQLGFLRGTATTLQNAATFGLTSQGTALAAGDLDADGVNDVAVGLASGNIQVELNRNNFSFIAGATVTGGGSGMKLAIAELTGDGLKDLAVANQGSQLQLYRGTGGGNLALFTSNFGFAPPGSIAVGDFNADGNADVVVGESVAGGIPDAELFASLRPIPAGTDTYSFTAPANTQILFMERGPSQIAWDAEIYSRAAAGTVTTTFPALSTLKPGRPAPAGQTVFWSPTLLIGTPANVSMDNFVNLRVKADAETAVAANPQYRR